MHPLFSPFPKCHAAAMLLGGAGKFCGPGAYSCQSGKAVAAIERSRAAKACVRSGWRGVELRGGVVPGPFLDSGGRPTAERPGPRASHMAGTPDRS